MRVPLTTCDFLDRAEHVYGDRVGVVDEPDQPAPVAGRADLPRSGPPRPGAGRPGSTRSASASGERVAVVSRTTPPGCWSCFFGVPACGRVLVPINFRLAPRRSSYIVEHSRRRGAARRPRARRRRCSGRRRAEHRFVLGRGATSSCCASTPSRARGPSRTRTPPRRSTTRQRHDRAAQGRADDPPQHLGQRGDLRPAHAASATATSTCTRCRCSTATAGGCRTPWPAWARRRSCCARSTAPRSCAGSSEHGVTLMCGAPAVWNAVLDAAAAWDGEIPAATGCASSSPARRRRRGRSHGSRPSSAGSSSRSTASPRPRRC